MRADAVPASPPELVEPPELPVPPELVDPPELVELVPPPELPVPPLLVEPPDALEGVTWATVGGGLIGGESSTPHAASETARPTDIITLATLMLTIPP